MSNNQGSINVQHKAKAAVVPPPATVTAANNGLSLSVTTAQLGQAVGAVGDPAILLNGREIPMGGFSFTMREGFRRLFQVDVANEFYMLGDFDGLGNSTYLMIDDPNQNAELNSRGVAQIGDVITSGNSTRIVVDDPQSQIELYADNLFEVQQASGFLGLEVNFATGIYRMGDIAAITGGGMVLLLDDAGSIATIANTSGGNVLSLDTASELYQIGDIGGASTGNALNVSNNVIAIGDDNAITHGVDLVINTDAINSRLRFFDNDGLYLDLSPTTNEFSFGDISGKNNQSWLTINDGMGEMQFFTTVNAVTNANVLRLSGSNGSDIYQIGDLGDNNGGTKISIDDGSGIILMESPEGYFLQNTNGDSFIMLDMILGIYQMGDIDGTVNGNFIEVNDSADAIIMSLNGNGLFQVFDQGLMSNILEITFGSPLTINSSDIMIATLTPYADGAAAQVGTLTNAPLAGNPTKWIPVDDNGTTRYIPAW